MLNFLVKDNGKQPEYLKVDDHTRSLRLSWSDYELLQETLHGYISEALTRRPKSDVLRLSNDLTRQWHAQDREKVPFLRREFQHCST